MTAFKLFIDCCHFTLSTFKNNKRWQFGSICFGSKADRNTGTARTLGETVQLATTTSGHYPIQLTRRCQILTNMEKDDKCKIVLISKQEKSNSSIAEKLHRQFVHPSIDKIVSLVTKPGEPWSENKELLSELKRIDKECTTCQVYRKFPPRPVGLPMATQFLEALAMDLKFYDKKIILHLIDVCTRLSAATMTKDKQPGTIIEAIFKIWISVYGSCEKFLVDNGGEFAN